jgi:phosphocarrier protein HPr
MEGVLTKEVFVINELGIHARPAGQLAQAAQRYASEVRLIHGDQQVDAKSILDILTLALARGTKLRIEAEGPDAAAALNHLESLFKNRFGEDR